MCGGPETGHNDELIHYNEIKNLPIPATKTLYRAMKLAKVCLIG